MPARAGAHQGAPSASITDANMGILDMLQEHLGPGQVQQISQQIGATPQQTETAVQAALPMMLGGMAGRAQQPDGGDSIMQALGGLGGGAGAGGLAGALGGMLGGGGGGGGLGGALGGALGGMLGGDGPGSGGGGGILGSILGGNEGTVERGVAQASGLDGGQARKLLMILAPIVLGMIAKRHGNASGGALGGALQEDAREAREQAERNQPGMGGILGDILAKVQTGR